MSLVSVSEARLRRIPLPVDDGAAQDIIDEEEAWLARRIGPLTGARTERFYVGVGVTQGRLGLRRFTDAVSVVDAGATVDPAHYRIVDHGASIILTYNAASWWWFGPYVEVTYTPSDEDEVLGAIYALIALASVPPSPYESEQIGSYSYSRGRGIAAPRARRGALASAIVPKRDQFVILAIGRGSDAGAPFTQVGDPLINRREPVA
jgi:hypothetical protein